MMPVGISGDLLLFSKSSRVNIERHRLASWPSVAVRTRALGMPPSHRAQRTYGSGRSTPRPHLPLFPWDSSLGLGWGSGDYERAGHFHERESCQLLFGLPGIA